MLLAGFVSIALYLFVVYLAPYSTWNAVEVDHSKHGTILSPPFAGMAICLLIIFNSSNLLKFQICFWISGNNFQRNGPVFFFDAGESGVNDEQAAQSLSRQPLFAPVEFARKYPDTDTTRITHIGHDAYKYLNHELALEDAVFFATHFSWTGYEHRGMTAKFVCWIWIGGSCPGIRVAMV